MLNYNMPTVLDPEVVAKWWDAQNRAAKQNVLMLVGRFGDAWTTEMWLRDYKNLPPAQQAEVDIAYSLVGRDEPPNNAATSPSSDTTLNKPQAHIRVRKCGAKMEVPGPNGQLVTFTCQLEKHQSTSAAQSDDEHEEVGYVWLEDGSYRHYRMVWSNRSFGVLRKKPRVRRVT